MVKSISVFTTKLFSKYDNDQKLLGIGLLINIISSSLSLTVTNAKQSI